MHWLQAVELVALPEGVEEVLPVTCNGRSGQLVVRTQRVQYGDSEVSASKFEQVCGKGDAKKWKCSIWIEGEDGSQVMVGDVCRLLVLLVFGHKMRCQLLLPMYVQLDMLPVRLCIEDDKASCHCCHAACHMFVARSRQCCAATHK